MTPLTAIVPSQPLTPGAESLAPDLVERIFQLLASELQGIEPARLERLKATAREEFGGQGAYIQRRDPIARQALQQEVLRRFDGRNATEVARALGIGRATVYRILKQSGQG